MSTTKPRGTPWASIVLVGLLTLSTWPIVGICAATPEPLKPLGEGKGIHPGRMVWMHDADATDWKGPGDGHWWEGNHTRQDRVDAMVSQALQQLTGQPTDAKAWDRLFRHFNRARGKGDVGYRPGEKILIKPNFVGMIWHEGAVNPDLHVRFPPSTRCG